MFSQSVSLFVSKLGLTTQPAVQVQLVGAIAPARKDVLIVLSRTDSLVTHDLPTNRKRHDLVVHVDSIVSPAL